MRKVLKKFFSVMLIVTLCLSSAPLQGIAELDWPEISIGEFNLPKLDFSKWFSSSAKALDASGSCGENVTYTFDSTTGELVISGTGAMANYSSGDSPFYDNSDITSVVIEDGVTTIGDCAFYCCGSLTSITIPESITTIGDRAFSSCYGLTSINIPESVTAIGDRAFSSCYGLTSINIPESVTAIGDYAFYFCDSLTSIDIPESVTTIGQYSFYLCRSLTSITIPEGVTTIGNYAFYFCDSLTSISIPESVTTIGECAFRENRLTKITVDENNKYYASDENGVLFNKDKTVLIQFPGGSTMTDYDIPESVTTIGKAAFGYCYSLTSIDIPESVTMIGDFAFGDCESLTSINLPEGVTTIGNYAFAYCDGLTSINLPEGVTTIGDRAFYDCDSLTSITILGSVTSIGSYAFSSCDGLTSINIPESVTSIGAFAFYGCTSLTIKCYSGSYAETYAKNDDINYIVITPSGTLSNGLTWEVSDNALILRGAETYIPKFSAGKAPWSKYASIIKEIYLFTEYVETIGSYSFYGLNNVEYIDIGSDSLTNVGKYAFGGINTGIDIWFYGKEEQWKKVDIDYGNDTLIGSDVFCSKTSSTIDSVHISIPSDMFDENSFVQEHIDFVNNSTIANQLSENSFNYCAKVSKKVLNAYNMWDVVGDVGEVVSLKFDDLTISADFYEMYLSDMILALNSEDEISKFECKVVEETHKVNTALQKAFRTSKEWEESITPSMLVEIDDFFSGKSYELKDNTSKFLEKVFNDLYKNNKKTFTSVFEGLSMASTVLDGVFAAADIVNAYIEAYNAYIVAKAFYEVNDEFFDVCEDTANKMKNTSKYKQYGKWFLKAIKEAKNSDMGNLDVIFEQAKSGGVVAYNLIFQEFVQYLVYPSVAKLLGCSAGSFSSWAFTYNVTYGILDAVFGLSSGSEQYKIINYIYPVEKYLQEIINSKEKNLLSLEDETSAISYDIAYRILRQTNIYLYEATYKHGSIRNNKDDMTFATAAKNLWNVTKCHNGTYGGKYNIFSAHCPVDVYIYDAENVLITSVVNEKVEEYDYRVTVMIGNGHKSFAYPADENFSFVIKAREEGTMDYSFATVDNVTVESEYESSDIALAVNQEFTVTIPAIEEADSEDYRLSSNDEYIDFDYDSTAACESHTFGEWCTGENNRTRVCTICGYTDFETACSHNLETIEVYSIIPTCTDIGHTINVCSGCGYQMQDGTDIEAFGHTPNENIVVTQPTCIEKGYTTYTCSDCGDTYVADYVDAIGHSYTSNIITEPTHLTEGVRRYVCACGDSYTEKVDKITEHTYTLVVTTPTCTENGYTTYVCSCGDTYTADETPSLGHNVGEFIITSAPTCINNGKEVAECSRCSYYETRAVGTTGHTDVNGDGYCDDCSRDLSPSANCGHMCHKTGFLGFIWKIVLFFQKLFGMNPTCECGAAHW